MPKKQIQENIQDIQLLQNEETGTTGRPQTLGKQKKIKKIIVYESESDEPDDESVDDSTFEAPKEVEQLPPKPKKKPTEKQLEALKLGLEKRRNNERLIREEKQRQKEMEQKQLEEKIIKKALSIKKKQIKKQAVLDDISDDETPIEHIKEIVKKTPKKDKLIPQHQILQLSQPKFYYV